MTSNALSLLRRCTAWVPLLPLLGPHVLPAQTVDAFNPGANNFVRALALQADGTVLVGGQFTNLAGQAQSRIGRLLPDGTPDNSFFTSADDTVWALAVQADGRPLAGGDFMNFSGQPTRRLGRLNMPGGGADGAFNPWPNGTVRCVAEQPDGLILVGGSFNYISFNTQLYLARLQSGGVLDTGFVPVLNGPVYALVLQPDGKILVSGGFTTVNTLPQRGLVRLNPDGSVDTAFSASLGTAYLGLAYALLVQNDGRIVVGGQFDSVKGQACTNLARLNPDGSIDPAFSASLTGGLDGAVYALSLQTDGKLIIGGAFANVLGQPRPGLARLYPDGSLDPNYFPAPGGQGGPLILAQALQADGKLVVGGWFTTMGGQPRNKLARLNSTDPATNVLTFDTASVTWQRGGSATEVWRTTFDYTTNGSDWISLGEGLRTASGWALTGLSLPTAAIVRAHGFVSGGSWFVESLAGPPLPLSQPYGASIPATQSFGFSVSAIGGLPVTWQWLKNGVPVSDGGNLWGAQTSTVNMTNVLGPNSGQYQVVVSNAWGSTPSQVATLTVLDPYVLSGPGNQSVNAGQAASFSVNAIGTTPLQYQWRLNGSPLVSATNASLLISNTAGADAGAYTVVVSNSWGALTTGVATLTVNLALPDSFNPGSRSTAAQILLQPDGKVLVSSVFGALNNPQFLARFNPDGSPDPGFRYTNVLGEASAPSCLALQADGRIIGSGLGRLQSWTLLRLYGNGLLDTSFTNPLSGAVYGLAFRPDGEAWVGGNFTFGKPAILTNLALLQANGAVDTNLLAGVNNTIYALALQPDGNLLAGGSFTLANGQPATRLARFTAAGALDTNFNASANNTVFCVLVQADGKILVAGNFTTLDGPTMNRVGRLNPDGTLDSAFNPNANNIVYAMALQTDGKIIIAGTFTTVAGLARNRLARLNPDGSLDLTFNPNASGTVDAVGLQADGAVVVAGSFSQLTGQYRTNIARLAATDPATEAFDFDGAILNWARGGAGPEVWRTTFETSTNGTDWLYLGAGQRVAGGWRLAGVSLPAQANARARGFVTGGQNNAASWFVESTLGPALVTSQPASRTNLAGTTATFWVSGGGTAPVSYQWLKAGLRLTDGGNVSGSATPTLTLSNVLGGDAAAYSVVISNANGSATSSVAYLTVIEPIITQQPTNQTGNAGQSASFTVAAIGSPPFTYQWRKNGTNMSAPNSATLTLANLSRADVATYSVLVSTPYGSALSSNAALSVNLAMPDPVNAGAAPGGQVRAIAVQPDGRIVVGGSFTNLAGQPRNYLGRFNADGSLDAAFNPGADNPVNCLAVQADGKLLLGGYFQTLAGQTRTCIARLGADGSLDANFSPTISLGGTPFVNALVVQPDGKILVGGQLGLLDGAFLPNIGRLNPDGSLDPTFSSSVNSPGILSVALQPDGRILLGGLFCNNWCYLDRLSPNGTLDSTFNLAPSSVINAIVVQPDGKIIIGGAFTSLLSTTRNYLARLNTNATLDTFNPGANGPVNTLALQADGKILVGGSFTTLGGQPRANLGRLNPDGSIDTAFFPSANSNVVALALQPDGAVLVGGDFTNLSGVARAGFTRLAPTDLAGQYLSSDSQSITWLRAGPTPELSRITFETSTDGAAWLNAGSPARIPGGWRLSGLALSRDTLIRARGYASGGYYSSSGFLVESIAQVLTPPSILSADGALGFHSGQFGFNTRAVPGQVVVIEASTDWQTWIPIQTNLVSTAGASIISGDSVLFSFTDPQSSLYPRRFYRARLYQGVPPPSITTSANFGFQSNRFGFNLAAVQGQTLVIDASTDLLNWAAILTNTMSSVSFYFSDPATLNFPRRFYRVREQ